MRTCKQKNKVWWLGYNALEEKAILKLLMYRQPICPVCIWFILSVTCTAATVSRIMSCKGRREHRGCWGGAYVVRWMAENFPTQLPKNAHILLRQCLHAGRRSSRWWGRSSFWERGVDYILLGQNYSRKSQVFSLLLVFLTFSKLGFRRSNILVLHHKRVSLFTPPSPKFRKGGGHKIPTTSFLWKGHQERERERRLIWADFTQWQFRKWNWYCYIEIIKY